MNCLACIISFFSIIVLVFLLNQFSLQDLLLITYAQKPPSKVHAGVSRGLGMQLGSVFIRIQTLSMQAAKL